MEFIRNPFFKVPKYTDEAFDNVEYQVRMTYTVETDKRIMSFVDTLWGIEVTGGVDQYEPLTVIGANRTGLARRAGIRLGDIITQINETPADGLTLKEAQLLIRKSGRFVRIYVMGDDDAESDDELTVDFWFRPRRPWRRDFTPIQWVFPWNDRKKPVYRESNCFMVPSIMEEKIRQRRAATSHHAKPKSKVNANSQYSRSLTPFMGDKRAKAANKDPIGIVNPKLPKVDSNLPEIPENPKTRRDLAP